MIVTIRPDLAHLVNFLHRFFFFKKISELIRNRSTWFCYTCRVVDSLFAWKTLDNVKWIPYFFFDPLVWAKVCQLHVLRHFRAFGTSHLRPLSTILVGWNKFDSELNFFYFFLLFFLSLHERDYARVKKPQTINFWTCNMVTHIFAVDVISEINWGSSNQAFIYTQALTNTLKLNNIPAHVKTFR